METPAEAMEAEEAAAMRPGRRGSARSAFKLNSVGAQFRKQLQACAHLLHYNMNSKGKTKCKHTSAIAVRFLCEYVVLAGSCTCITFV